MLSTTVTYSPTLLTNILESKRATFIYIYYSISTLAHRPKGAYKVYTCEKFPSNTVKNIQWIFLSIFSMGEELSLGELWDQPRLHFWCSDQPCKYSKPVRNPSQREMAGQCLLHSRRAQRVSVRTCVYRVTRQLALVIVIFHPGHNFRW